ncbi:MAG: diaminopimelate epimerase [Bacteroidota bacterium]|jgi:diaminopimelate epimerase
MKIPFTKMSGAGNDFVVVDNRENIIIEPHQFSISACDRRLGIGADGLLLVEKSDHAAFTMKYYNADGSNAGMCGNGGRCIAKFAFDNDIIKTDSFIFEAFGFDYRAIRHAPLLYELWMKNPIDLKRDQNIPFSDSLYKGNYLNTGTDHSIIFIEDNQQLGSLDAIDVFKIGRAIRYHDVYQPIGTNVNFVSKDGANRIRIRTYERGVEDETLACGTGSVASALLSSLRYGFQSPVSVMVKSGKTLEINFEKINQYEFQNVRLKGPAETVFTGVIDINNTFRLVYK